MPKPDFSGNLRQASRRIFAVAKWTVTEALHLHAGEMTGAGVLAVGLLALVLRGLHLGSAEVSLLASLSGGVISLVSIGIACLLTAQLFFDDVQSGFITAVVSRALGRSEYLIGRFCGVAAVLSGAVGLMALAAFALVTWRGHEMGLSSAQPGQWLQAGAIIWMKATLVAGLALLVSCYAESLSFSVVISLALTGLSHAQTLLESSRWQWSIRVLPDLAKFDHSAALTAASGSWNEIIRLSTYGGLFAILLLIVASALFQRREF